MTDLMLVFLLVIGYVSGLVAFAYSVGRWNRRELGWLAALWPGLMVAFVILVPILLAQWIADGAEERRR